MPDVAIRPACNQNCIFCSNPPEFKFKTAQYSFVELKKRIDEYARGNKDVFLRFGEDNIDWNITGGEPTLNPEYFKILSYIREKFPQSKIIQLTNGRKFADNKFIEEISQIPNYHVIIPLHGYNAVTHDENVGSKGAFNEAIRGIYNILKYKKYDQTLEIRIIITQKIYLYLHKIYQLIYQLFPKVDTITTIFMEFEGKALENKEEVGISYEEVKKNCQEIFKKYSKGYFNDFRLYHFPLCTIDEELWPYVWRTLPEDEIEFLPECEKCVMKKYCLGIHEGYLPVYGENEFKPFSNKKILEKIVENQNNFEFKPIIDIKNIIKKYKNKEITFPHFCNCDKIIKKETKIKMFEEKLVNLKNYGIDNINAYYSEYTPPYYFSFPGVSKYNFVRKTVAEKLKNINLILKDHGLELFIFDGYRPLEIQKKLYYEFMPKCYKKKYPDADIDFINKLLNKYISKPPEKIGGDLFSNIPPHCTGGAVDLTIRYIENKQLLEMGSIFDDLSEISRVDYYEQETESFTCFEAKRNRRLLFHLMINEGFSVDSSEWWHFDYGNKNWGKFYDEKPFYGYIEN